MIALGMMVLGAGQARAAAVTTTYCIEYTLSYTDGTTGDELTGSTIPARGNRIQFIRNSTSATVFDGYLDGTTGCITMDGTGGTVQLDDSFTYTVKLPREASVWGNTILVRNSSGGSYTAIPKEDLVPSSGHTYSEANGDFWASLAVSDPSSILAVATHALWDHDAGLNEMYELRNAGCGGSGTDTCYDDVNEIVWIGSPDRKFVIAYALGLAVGHFANGHDAPDYHEGAAVDDCINGLGNGGHLINTKEFASTGAVHGLARFYAALAFNDEAADDDCEYQATADVDWNTDQDDTDSEEDETFSCSGDPAPSQPIGAFAYFDTWCGGSGQINNRGTVYDWLKFWWDWRTDSYFGPHSVPDIYQLWDDADPDTWTVNGNLGGGTMDQPYDRLYDADGGGVFGDFNTLASGVHGVHH